MKREQGFGEVLAIVAVLVGGLAALIFVIMTLGQFYGQYQCSNFEDITGKETRWAAYDICYIKTESGWERWDEYKARAAASEGLKAGSPR